MGLFELIFGKKIKLKDPYFGKVVSSRTKSKNPEDIIEWNITHLFNPFQKPTYIVLNGNCENMDYEQRDNMIAFIEEWDARYMNELDAIIESNPDYENLKNWKNEYYLAFIAPLEVNDGFDVNFEKIKGEDEGYFYFELIGNEITELYIV